jgi:D-alanyl-D-alanine carboxypeptidase
MMRRWKSWLFVALLGLSLSLSISLTTHSQEIPVQSLLHAEFRPALDERIKGMMARQHIPGMAIVVIKDGLVIERRGYGVADLKTRANVGADTAFPIGSVTKQFTATAIMLLVEAGKLDLDQPIRQYLSDLSPSWQPLTLRQLLSHTSGLSETYDWGKVKNPKDILKFGNPTLDFPPGESWSYSNTGFLIAGQIIEAVSGQSYQDFMRDRIFQPLGMDHTQAAVTPVPKLAMGYVWNNALLNHSFGESDLTGWQWADAAGNIISTATDMTQWAEALNAQKLLTPASYEQLWSATALKNGRRVPYGLGWSVGNFNQHLHIEHGGQIAGYASGFYRLPSDRLDVIVLTNQAGADGVSIARSIASVYDPSVSIQSLQVQTDPNPDFTQRFVKLLQGDDTSLPFSPEYEFMQKTRRGQAFDTYQSAFRPIGSLEFLRQETQYGDRTTYYRTSLNGKTVYARITMTAQQQVADYAAGSPP